ncbi:MAG: AAA family ATPase [Accumulibacter sp.]|jgi:MSHA biogenesis protein MshM
MMYLEHFGLQQAPFRITPHIEFFFAGANRGATLEALIYAITNDEGIVKVSGEVGSGKTMLCRMLLEKLPENVETVYLANPMLSRDEILFAIAAELGIDLPAGQGQLLLRALQDHLLEIYAAGRQIVVLIDEAHAMPADALEEIRLLSNLESSRHKLLQIVLFGQPELDQRLRESAMRQLNDRITHSFSLAPLHRSDVAAYLMFRLRAAGYRGPDLFSRRAVQLISRSSEGLTRRINILADKALLAAFAAGRHQVDAAQVRAAIRDAQFQPIAGRAHGRWAWAAVAALVMLGVATVAYLAGSHSAGSQVRSPPQAKADTAVTGESAPAAVATVAVATAAPAVATTATVAAVPATPAASAAPATPAAPAAPATPATPATPAVPPPPALPVRATVWSAAPAASAAAARAPSLAQRLAASEEWLRRTPDSHHFIQLLMADAGSQREIDDFIAKNSKVLDPGQVRVYRSLLAGRERLGVIYGDYASREEANAALATLGELSPASRPYVRSVARLRSGGPVATPAAPAEGNKNHALVPKS